MEDWVGFTEADLRKMKAGKQRPKPMEVQHPEPQLLYHPQNARRPRPKNLTGTRKMVSASQGNFSESNLLLDQMLSTPKQGGSAKTSDTKSIESERSQNIQQTSKQLETIPVVQQNDSSHQKDQKLQCDALEMTHSKDTETEMVTDDKEIISREMSSLKSFQQQQKMIEELNKKKKILLSTAIQQRQKKAKAEAAKLSQIQRELNRLDQMVNEDVSIIRDKIEDASREYLTAQKRYDRAEKEFIESKMDLHDKVDLKESLTEHLYTVIHQNEMRKAKKLAELMNKLEMESAEDIEELKNFTLPNLTLLNQFQVSSPQNPMSPHSPLSPHSPNSAEANTSSVQLQSQSDKLPSESGSKNKQSEEQEITADKLKNINDTLEGEANTDKNKSDVPQSQVSNKTEESSEGNVEATHNSTSSDTKGSELVTLPDKEQLCNSQT